MIIQEKTMNDKRWRDMTDEERQNKIASGQFLQVEVESHDVLVVDIWMADENSNKLEIEWICVDGPETDEFIMHVQKAVETVVNQKLLESAKKLSEAK